MSKKAKGVVLGGFQPMSSDAKARFKSQTLLLEYQDLQKEASGVRMKLDIAKQRRNELLAEVRFLRKRHRYLVKIKSTEQPEVQEKNQKEVTIKDRNLGKSEAARFKLPPLPPSKPKGRDYGGTSSKNISSSFAPLNHNKRAQSGKDATSQHNLTDINYIKRISRDNDAVLRDTFHSRTTQNFQSGKTPNLDLNLDNGEEAVFPSRIPTFDLNEVSMEEEEVQVVGDDERRFEESKKSVYDDEQMNDMKITSSVCRNKNVAGGGGGIGPSRIGKRKISWQDPVALSV